MIAARAPTGTATDTRSHSGRPGMRSYTGMHNRYILVAKSYRSATVTFRESKYKDLKIFLFNLHLISILNQDMFDCDHSICVGFVLACECFGRMFDHSFSACAFFFFFRWRLARAH